MKRYTVISTISFPVLFLFTSLSSSTPSFVSSPFFNFIINKTILSISPMARGKRKPRSKRGTKRQNTSESTEEPRAKRNVPTAPEKDTTSRRHKRIYEAKGIPAEQVTIAKRTIHCSMDTVLKKLPTGANKEAAKRIEYRSKGAGYLMLDFYTFMNHAIDGSIDAEDPFPEDAEFPLPHDLHLHEDLCDIAE